ncbi:hypothetical protein CICLE_v10029687mg [Citrus x clementina]|uniref:Uncharacterized protein n=1 Tax=Citrus clementina TaxID=85681 RepID=V4RPY6_CITCL|nr:hypothetical protein CICLE_v10029687mg [Citrus x clementina]
MCRKWCQVWAHIESCTWWAIGIVSIVCVGNNVNIIQPMCVSSGCFCTEQIIYYYIRVPHPLFLFWVMQVLTSSFPFSFVLRECYQFFDLTRY